MQEDIVFCNRLEHSHLHFPWCRGGDWQRERNKPRPILLAFPTLHLPRAASTTHLPCHPKQNRPLGISLAPKTQLRHQGKERPVWQGCLAPNTDAGTLNGRGARDPQTQRPPRAAIPANSYLPIRPTSGNFLLEQERVLPLQLLPCGLLGLSPLPPPSAPSLSNNLGFIY